MRSEKDEKLRALFSKHGASAVRLAYVLTGDRELAEDIAQDAFVRIGSKLRGLNDPARAGGYLHQTVLNLARGHGRRAAVESKAISRLERDRPQGEPLDRPTRDLLWESLLSLPRRQRAALFLRYYEDLPEAEVADVLGCSVSAVKSLVLRATTQLRDVLTKEQIQ